MKLLSLTINGEQIVAPSGIPTGGLSGPGTNLINLGINFLFIIGSVMAVVFIMYSGIQWITSGGDEKKIEKARGRLTYSIIGLLVVVGSFFIINTVLTLLGQSSSSSLMFN